VAYIREDQAAITVTVDGIAYGESWASVEGGNLEADDSKTRPGGMGKEVSVGGPASREDITVQTQLSDVVLGWHKTLENKIGTGRVKVGVTFLGADRLPTGASQTMTGVLKSVALPDMAADGNEVGMYQLVVSADELAA
jgi:hypothetical protein